MNRKKVRAGKGRREKRRWNKSLGKTGRGQERCRKKRRNRRVKKKTKKNNKMGERREDRMRRK